MVGMYHNYKDPQLLCPDCDPSMYGAFMNEDLFPHLSVLNHHAVEVRSEADDQNESA